MFHRKKSWSIRGRPSSWRLAVEQTRTSTCVYAKLEIDDYAVVQRAWHNKKNIKRHVDVSNYYGKNRKKKVNDLEIRSKLSNTQKFA